jgi:hypothetical protein
MVDVATAGQTIEGREDLGTGDQAIFDYWQGQEAVAEKDERAWIKRARLIVQRYRDERPEADANVHRFNILWSNVQTLKPTLYARTPKPDVDRRFKDPSPVARYASQLLERCLSYSASAFDFDSVVKACVEDRLLPGRGVARVLYVPHFGEPIEAPEGDEKAASDEGGEPNGEVQAKTDEDNDEPDDEEFEARESADSVVDNEGDEGDADEDKKGEPLRNLDYEEVVAKYVFWEDYREGPARQWAEVPWLRYRSYLTREELTERFGKANADKVELDYIPKGLSEAVKAEPPPDLYKKAIVHEYWDKVKKQVIWIAPGTSGLILDTQDDPLELPDFFPNPDPLLATTTNETRIPVPDYAEYQDQARELDSLTARIDKLTNALKVSGIYPGEEKAVLQQLIAEGTENRLIPIHDYQNWSDKGGLKSFIEWFPIQQVAETLIQLYNARDRVKAVLYELTGIGDIMRGMTQPEETLGAQELKAVFATRRISPQQKDVARFARDLFRLMGGVIAEHFSEKTISMITGFPVLAPVPQLPPMPQASPSVTMKLLAMQHAAAQPPAPAGAPGQSNVVAMPGMGGGAAPGQAGPEGPPAAPAPPPDPEIQAYAQAMMQWKDAQQKVQQIQQANAQKQQDFSAAVALIKEDGVHGFKIDIEADSTIAPDEQAEKKARTEFLGEFIPLMQQVIPIAQGNPAMAELAKQITLFGVRAFPTARGLEETIEKAFDAIAALPPHPSQQPPQKDSPDSPAALALRKHEIDSRSQTETQKLAVQEQKIATDARIKTLDIAATSQDATRKLALEAERGARQDAITGARLTHIESRDASRLT